MCAPVVQVSDVISSRDIEGPDDVWISAGRVYAVPISVNVPDTALIWQFSTKPKVRHQT